MSLYRADGRQVFDEALAVAPAEQPAPEVVDAAPVVEDTPPAEDEAAPDEVACPVGGGLFQEDLEQEPTEE